MRRRRWISWPAFTLYPSTHDSLTPTLPSGGISARSGTRHLCLRMMPRMPGSRASRCSMRSAAEAGGWMTAGTGSARYSVNVYGCSEVEGGPGSFVLRRSPPAAEAERPTCPFRRRRSRSASSSNPRTRWSTPAAASSAAMAAAGVPMSISGLVLSHRPSMSATRRDASSSLPGRSVPARTLLAFFSPRIFCVDTEAPVVRSRTAPRSLTEASHGTSTAYAFPRYETRTVTADISRVRCTLRSCGTFDRCSVIDFRKLAPSISGRI